MKAAICTSYGPPEVIEIRQVKKPGMGDKELLVKIKAASVNSGDVRIRGFDVDGIFRIVMRFVIGFRKPRKPILGLTFSGIVEETGSKVTNFKIGDEIMGSTGFQMGTHAEYISLKERKPLVLKPSNATFDEAAAIVFGGNSALYFLDKAGIKKRKGQQVLIYGATGSVGAAAVEIAKYFGAEVTAVCSKEGEPLAQKLGSDHIVIYTDEDFTKLNKSFDIIFDAVGKTSKKESSGLLTENGKFVTVGGMDVASETRENIAFLKELFEKGFLHANIDRTYSLDDIVEAHRYVDEGRKKANVVISVVNSE